MKILYTILGFFLSVPALAQTNAFQGYCEVGNIKPKTQGASSATTVQGSYPKCIVNVYLTGTTTHASITQGSGGSGSTANPFTANTDGSWRFWALDGQGYDVNLSGGVPLALPAPVVLVDLIHGGGGGGGGGGCSTGGIPTTNGSVTGDSTSTNCGTNNRVGDSIVAPGSIYTFGYTNGANMGGNSSPVEAVFIGDTNATSLTQGFNTTEVMALGDHNLNGGNQTGFYTDVICQGDQNCDNATTSAQSLEDIVAIGDRNAIHSVWNPGNNVPLNNSVAIGARNLQNINSDTFGGANIVAIGADNVKGVSGGSWGVAGVVAIGLGNANSIGGSTEGVSHNVNAIVAIGQGAAETIQGQVNDIVAIGDGAYGYAISGSFDNIAIGDGALRQCRTLTGCSPAPNPIAFHASIGIGGGGFNQGSLVTAVGDGSLGATLSPTLYNSGNNNTAIGALALPINTTGTNNTAVGVYAGGDGFVFSPPNNGNANQTGSNNTWIGYDSGPNTTTQLSNTVALGYQAHNTASNQTVVGNSSITSLILFGCPTGDSVLADGSGTCYLPGSGGSGGTNVSVNGGSALTTANLNATTPAAGTNGINVTWQVSSSNVSAEIVGDGNASHFLNGTGTFTTPAGGTGTVTNFIASSGSWPTWLVPSVATSTTTPTLSVSASAIPNSALATQTANTVLGALTATTPSGLAMPSCSSATNALTWTTGTGFGCNTISGGGGGGTVTSVGFTGGLISVGTPTTTPAFTVAGTSGGIPYFSSASTWASSAALPSGDFVLGGGAGSAPTATFSVVTAAKGGTGVSNTASLTLGTSNQNWGTLGTGIVKNTTATGAISNALSADVITLWTGTCNSSTYLRADGACAASVIPWSGIINPTTNLSLTMAANTTILTYNAATATSDLFGLTDTTSNTGTGIMLHPHTQSGSTEIPFQADSNGNGWQVAADGSWQGVGSGTSHGMALPEGTLIAGAAGKDVITADSGTHRLLINNNNGGYYGIAGILPGTTGTITGTSLTASCDSGTVTITGATVGAGVIVSSTTGADVGGAFNLRASVTSANTVTVYVCGTGTPASLAYNVGVIQ